MSRSSSRPRSSQAGLKRPPRPPPHPEPNLMNSPSLGQRSRSLTTLQQAVILQPRMAQLETLEAKMASIEVSLSNSHRRKKSGSLFRTAITKDAEVENLRKSIREKENAIQNLKMGVPGLKLRESCNSAQPLSDKEKSQIDIALSTLKSEVEAKKLAIKNLKMALDRLDISDNIDVRIRQAELEFQLGREELNLLTLLEEARALQACLDEAERRYNAPDAHTLYRCVTSLGAPARLFAVELEFDPRNPKFGAGPKEKQPGLWVDWALQDIGIREGDRLVEVNGKIVLDKTREDLQRLLSAAPDPAQIILLRGVPENCKDATSSEGNSEEISSLKSELGAVKERAEEAQRAKDGLVADNIRLTHRISYLEEQVAELLSRQQTSDIRQKTQGSSSNSQKIKPNVTSININAPPGTVSQGSGIQVFQKGHLTALVGISEDRPRSSLSSSGMSTPTNGHYHKTHRHRQRGNSEGCYDNARIGDEAMILQNGYDKERHRNHVPRTWSGGEKMALQNGCSSNEGDEAVDCQNSVTEDSYRKATRIMQDLMYYKSNNGHCVRNCEKTDKYSTDILKHFNSRKSSSMVDFANQREERNHHKEFKSVEELDSVGTVVQNGTTDARSVKSLDFDSDCTSVKSTNNGAQKYTGYTSEPTDCNVRLRWGEKARPTPPKKPIRLSLHKAQSLQFVDTAYDPRKPLKRNHRGEMQPAEQETATTTTATTRTSYRINA